MNFIFISPNFPDTYYHWVEALRRNGANVLGVGDTPYDNLRPELKANLCEYYFTPNLGDKNAMDAAVAYFQNKYGKIDFIESMNEWWLEEDARLRTKFNVSTGFHSEQMAAIKAKSEMKRFFELGGAKTIRYLVVEGKKDKERAAEFVKKVGFPVFVKPNVGVGASDSYSIKTQEQFDAFFEKTLPEPYIMEEFINGYLLSFDGICNEEGDVVFATTDHFPVPPAIIVNDMVDFSYYDIPFGLDMAEVNQKEFERIGRGVVKAFGISKRFFHIEFFMLTSDKKGLGKKGDFVGLECNMRAPGGYTPDLINFGNSLSCYQVYADVICFNENRQKLDYEKFISISTCRRDRFNYVHSVQEIWDKYRNQITMSGRYPDHISDDMGNDFYFAKFKTFAEAMEYDAFIRAKR